MVGMGMGNICIQRECLSSRVILWAKHNLASGNFSNRGRKSRMHIISFLSRL